jgi:hypothetical protein
MRIWMIALLLLSSQVPNLNAQFQPPRSEPLGLGDDKLGESLSSFTSLHPNAKCENSTKARSICYQWSEVSIFGMTAHPDPGCSIGNRSSPDCVQGINAQFVNERLISLSYAVEGTDKTDATTALKKRFGNPLFETREATLWSIGKETASVIVGKATERKDGPTLITFLIAVTN